MSEICLSQNFRPLQLLVRVKQETNQFGEPSVRYVVVRAQPLDVAAENQSLLKKLDVYGQLMDD